VTQDAQQQPASPYPELDEWNASLSRALDIPPADVERILSLAGVAAHRVIRPAAPVTTFLVGYASGTLIAGGMAADEAFRRATAIADQLLADRPSATPE
jgi:hypothetical protein